MANKAWLWLMLAGLLTSCSFDHDEEYVPSWQGAWWVIEDSNGDLIWLQISKEAVLEFQTDDAPIALDRGEAGIWSVDESGVLRLRSLTDGDPVREWTIPGGVGQDVTVGLDQIYVSTEAGELHLFQPKTETWFQVDVPGVVGIIQARADRCFVVVDDTTVVKIQEQSMSPVETIVLNDPIFGFANDGTHYTYAFQESAAGLILSRLSYHPDVRNFLQKAQPFDQLLVNSLLRQQYGMEYPGDLTVDEGCLVEVPQICGETFWPVWEIGEILVIRSDSLFRYDLTTGEQLHAYGQVRGSLLDGVNIME